MSEPVNFEAALSELQSIVEKMEHGNLSLDASLSAFEQGIRLTQQCQKALADAEQKVQILLQKSGEETLAPFTEAPVNGHSSA